MNLSAYARTLLFTFEILTTQMHCPLDSNKSYQRPKLSDPAHEGIGLQPRREGRVRSSAWLGKLVALVFKGL